MELQEQSVMAIQIVAIHLCLRTQHIIQELG